MGMHENVIGTMLIRLALRVHTALGPGLLESAYRACLAQELMQSGLKFETEKTMSVMYQGKRINLGYRIDLLIEDKVIVELKSVEELHPIHMAQLLTYLKLTGTKLGYLINFNTLRLKNGIHRVVNNL
jgi:GxxExxY protein